ncbi:MAG TPA: AI-2E family transporter [Methylibium sp.]|uniref:AI-2E family transporter n=1 Tax=Methylibium sp. TaxID=2067992 RepID=UPI002DB9B316|nr:AI-2E family transporter [Methylibium sp.]HEU4459103.1 AI-2E family transporter [Methylibium sp.]
MPWHASWVGKGLFAIALIFLLKEAQPVLVPITVAIVMTFVLARPVRALHRHGIPQAVGAGIVVVALIAGIVLMAGSLAGPAAKWWERAPTTVAQLVEQWERVRATIPILRGREPALVVAPPLAPAGGAPASPARRIANERAAEREAAQRIAEQRAAPAAAPPADALGSTIAAEGIALTRLVLGRFVSFGIATIATVMLLYFLLASEHWMLSRAVQALPRRRHRFRVLVAVRRAQRDVGHFLGTLAIVNLGLGVLTAFAVAALGLENPLLWGTLAGALNFIPYLGPLLMAGLLALAGVLSFEHVGAMLAPAIAFLALHGLEANFISPWLIGRRVSLSPAVVFASVMLMGWLWGVAGAMLAVPLLIGLRCGLRCVRSCRPWCVALEGHTRDLPTLQALLQRKRDVGADATVLRGPHAAGQKPPRRPA